MNTMLIQPLIRIYAGFVLVLRSISTLINEQDLLNIFDIPVKVIVIILLYVLKYNKKQTLNRIDIYS